MNDQKNQVKATVLAFIRKRYGKLSAFSRRLGKSAAFPYALAAGRGSRSARVSLAFEMGRRPSEVWPHLSDLVKFRDDLEYYNRHRNGGRS